MSKLKAARDEYGFWDVWTVDRRILYKVDDTPDSKPGSKAEKNSFEQRSFVLV